ncbi:MAG: L,D-transpeptidase [Bacteroidales bacterium]|nr:L,D-transpeptidase [Bacteroidales bacterium]MCF8352639.1 L,D-transpeptidase [Bacteroidales bacterium]MCF8376519.1 L,D-transpeptidase [Bacteroidales bacterium]MCF8400629.1 L,D-transpeptidase [Bacteroidales bacterium]
MKDNQFSQKAMNENPSLLISPATQTLSVYKGDSLVKTYVISTAKNGLGCEAGSGKTPTGLHRVKEKFGEGKPIGAIFKARAFTGEIAQIYTDDTDIEGDPVTTRILWLEGLEEGKNKGPGVDSYYRYIYIHGTPEEGLLGRPASKGCIRMSNKDVIELFGIIPVGTPVNILDEPWQGKQTEQSNDQ